MTILGIAGLGTQELILILLVLVLLFGATKLPDLARGTGRALRIFKAETQGLMDDDDAATPTVSSAIETRQSELEAKQAELDAERERLKRGEL
ncbi:twin-arginine translocase TatA/TatE family subunit [Nocardioides sp.]|uniref:twin-arginine translocase TatA/TatE family subunit n=1 Tax=Nocardioides sp. TaxID=35761 RepID=UPI0039E6F8F8